MEKDRERFENAVYDFLKMIRKNNPEAHIVWVYGMLGYDLALSITNAMNRYQKDTGDQALFVREPQRHGTHNCIISESCTKTTQDTETKIQCCR